MRWERNRPRCQANCNLPDSKTGAREHPIGPRSSPCLRPAGRKAAADGWVFHGDRPRAAADGATRLERRGSRLRKKPGSPISDCMICAAASAPLAARPAATCFCSAEARPQDDGDGGPLCNRDAGAVAEAERPGREPHRRRPGRQIPRRSPLSRKARRAARAEPPRRPSPAALIGKNPTGPPSVGTRPRRTGPHRTSVEQD